MVGHGQRTQGGGHGGVMLVANSGVTAFGLRRLGPYCRRGNWKQFVKPFYGHTAMPA
jgi:hypothetical protein